MIFLKFLSSNDISHVNKSKVNRADVGAEAGARVTKPSMGSCRLPDFAWAAGRPSRRDPELGNRPKARAPHAEMRDFHWVP